MENNIQMPFDMACNEFSKNLVNLINEQSIPSTAIFLIMKDILGQVERIKDENRLKQEREYLEQTGQLEQTKTITGQAEIVNDEEPAEEIEAVPVDMVNEESVEG